MEGITVKKLTNKIIYVKFNESKIAARAVIRVQEYYESKKFSGKLFTLGELRKHLIGVEGVFNYEESVSGYNFPAKAMLPFFLGMFDPLGKEEREFVEAFRGVDLSHYIIITSEDGSTVVDLSHELCHALFYTDRDYKTQILNVLFDSNLVPAELFNKMISDIIHKLGYSAKVAVDEAHAYLCTDTGIFSEKHVVHPTNIIEQMRSIAKKRINDIYKN